MTLSPASVLAQSGFNPYNPPNNSYNDPTGKQESGAGIQYSGADMNYASRVVYAEASNNYAEQKAVASVIYNRVASTGYSGGVQYTLSGVCNAPNQFESVTNNTSKFTSSADPSGFGPAQRGELTAAVGAVDEVIIDGPTVSYTYFQAYTGSSETNHPNGERIGNTWFYFP